MQIGANVQCLHESYESYLSSSENGLKNSGLNGTPTQTSAIVKLVEHCTRVAEVRVRDLSRPVVFRPFFFMPLLKLLL